MRENRPSSCSRGIEVPAAGIYGSRRNHGGRVLGVRNHSTINTCGWCWNMGLKTKTFQNFRLLYHQASRWILPMFHQGPIDFAENLSQPSGCSPKLGKTLNVVQDSSTRRNVWEWGSCALGVTQATAMGTAWNHVPLRGEAGPTRNWGLSMGST